MDLHFGSVGGFVLWCGLEICLLFIFLFLGAFRVQLSYEGAALDRWVGWKVWVDEWVDRAALDGIWTWHGKLLSYVWSNLCPVNLGVWAVWCCAGFLVVVVS